MLSALDAPAHPVRRVVLTIVAAVALLALLPLAAVARPTADAAEAHMLELLRADRDAVGAGPLRTSAALTAIARDRAATIAASGTLHHPDGLRQQIEAKGLDWRGAAENVGRGPDLDELHDAFIASPGHRDNLRAPNWDGVGIGAVHDGRRWWISVVFLESVSGAYELPTSRLAGASRTETSAAISQHAFADGGARGVVLADAHDFRGALAASALAGAIDAPILLTATDALDDAARDELRRALGDRVDGAPAHVVGEMADAVIADLGALGLRVTHHATGDADRLAARLARTLPQRPERAFLATSATFADALGAAAVAAATGWPVLFTDGDELPGPTRRAIEDLGIDEIVIVGGTAAVSAGVAEAVAATGATVRRVSGADRYETSAAIAAFGLAHGMVAHAPILATGHDHPDALSGSTLARAVNSPLLLTDPNVLSGPTHDWLATHADGIAAVHVLGGSGAVSDAVRAAAARAD